MSGWDSRRRAKAARITAGAAHCDGKVIKPGNLADLLHSVIQPGDRVALEGDNQKQADYLSRTLAGCDPQRLHDLHMLISSVSRPEQLPTATTFEVSSTEGIAITHCPVARSAAKL